MRKRCELSCSTDFPSYIKHGGYKLFRSKFVCNFSAGEFIRTAHFLKEADIIKLDYHSVDKKIKTAPSLRCFFNFRDNTVNITKVYKITHWQSVVTHETVHFTSCGEFHSFNVSDIVANTIELSLGSYLRVKVADRTGCCISCIFQAFLTAVIQLFKNGKAHITFAANFKFAFIRHGKRNRANCFCLCKYTFACNAVSACCGLNENPVIVCQVDR